MRIVSSIYELEYYKPRPNGIECYCERLIYADDLMLQAPLRQNQAGGYTMAIHVYSADGKTFLEDATSAFSWYIFRNPATGRDTFNIRLESFTNQMCAAKCWILRIIVDSGPWNVFNGYTDQYCQAQCCDLPRRIEADQVGLSGLGTPQGWDILEAPPKIDPCGRQYITIEVADTCASKFTGKYYQHPEIISGSGNQTWAYLDRLNLQGQFSPVPNESTRIYSFHGRLQRQERRRAFEIKSNELLPDWKMQEIQDMLTSEWINIEGANYNFDGGPAFERIDVRGMRGYMWELRATMYEHYQRQYYRCGDLCDNRNTTVGFMIGSMKMVYDEDRNVISDDPDVLLEWFRGQPGVTAVTELDPGDYSCSFDLGFTVEGTGYIPSLIYVGGTDRKNRVYGLNPDQLADACTTIAEPCAAPEIGVIMVAATVCAAPEIGVIMVEDETGVDLNFMPQNWNDEGSTATLIQGSVTIMLKLSNTSYPIIDPTDPPFAGEIVGRIDTAGRPMTVQTFHRDEYTITVDPAGYVWYFGAVIEGDNTKGEIDDLISYNI